MKHIKLIALIIAFMLVQSSDYSQKSVPQATVRYAKTHKDGNEEYLYKKNYYRNSFTYTPASRYP